MRSAALLLLLVSLPAHAYVQTRTKSGTAVRWPQSCIVVQPDARGDTADSDVLTIDDIDTALTNAVTNWNGKDTSCTFMRLGVIPAYQALDVVADNRPAVVFRSANWTHDARVIALTTVWFADRPNQASDGLITDADIELNAVDYSFTTNVATTTPRTGTDTADLENTLTHELGHVLGLAHTCFDHTTPEALPDNNGDPAPDCDLGSSLPAVVLNATMYPYASPTNPTGMRNLSADDIGGICGTYPSTGTPLACYGDIVTRGCSVSPRAPESRAVWLLFLAPLVATLLGRRMRRDSVA